MNKQDWDEIYDYDRNLDRRKQVYPLSGWKAYICGESETDSKFLRSILEETLIKYNLGWKSSKDRFFEISKGTRKERVAFFIYFPVNIINDLQNNKIVQEISSVLIKNGYLKDFPLVRSKKLCNSIYCRYELSVPFRKEGFSREDYHKFRVSSKDSIQMKNFFTDFLQDFLFSAEPI